MNKHLGGFCVVTASIAVLSLGCGGGSDLRCGEVAPCGGDLVGSWELKAACFDTSRIEAAAADVCPGFRLLRYDLQVSGTVTFTATGYTSATSRSVTFEETIPADCALLAGTTCAELGASLENGGCSGETVCSCSGTMAGDLFSAAGTYTTSGNTLSLMDMASGEMDSVGYCVSDGMLHFPVVAPDPMGMMGDTTIAVDIVGERR